MYNFKVPSYELFTSTNNTITEKYSGAARIDAPGFYANCYDRRDGTGSRAVVLHGYPVTTKEFEGDSWLECFFKAAAYIDEVETRPKRVRAAMAAAAELDC